MERPEQVLAVEIDQEFEVADIGFGRNLGVCDVEERGDGLTTEVLARGGIGGRLADPLSLLAEGLMPIVRIFRPNTPRDTFLWPADG